RPRDYVYDNYYNCVICPHNQVLSYSTTNRDGYRVFKSDPAICAACPDLAKCTSSRNHQKVVIKHIWEDYIERAEDYRHTEAGKKSYELRGETIERVFADAKEKHGMRYTFHRGLARVTKWVTLKFAAMNLKKLALWVSRTSFFCFDRAVLCVTPTTKRVPSTLEDTLFRQSGPTSGRWGFYV
ncbi:MAG TPA: transposase, partial [Limnochordia bacterium]|nr:transposase [Limnochordia bacterium]